MRLDNENCVGFSMCSYYSHDTLFQKRALAVISFYDPVLHRIKIVWVTLQNIACLSKLLVVFHVKPHHVVVTAERSNSDDPVYRTLWCFVQEMLSRHQKNRYSALLRAPTPDDTFFIQLLYDGYCYWTYKIDPSLAQYQPWSSSMLFSSISPDIETWFLSHATGTYTNHSFDSFLEAKAYEIQKELFQKDSYTQQVRDRFLDYMLLELFFLFCLRDADDLDLRTLFALVTTIEALDITQAFLALRLPDHLWSVYAGTIPYQLRPYHCFDRRKLLQCRGFPSGHDRLILSLIKEQTATLYLDLPFVKFCSAINFQYPGGLDMAYHECALQLNKLAAAFPSAT